MIWIGILALLLLAALIYQVADDARLIRIAMDFQTDRLLAKLNKIEQRLDEIGR